MATKRRSVVPILLAAAMLLWPAIWNGYPIVFADSGTYLSQAVHRYLGWDRPVFYSLFLLPLHLTISLWPVIVAQALLAAVVLERVGRILGGPVLGGPVLGGPVLGGPAGATPPAKPGSCVARPVLMPSQHRIARPFQGGLMPLIGLLAAASWLPFLVCQVMPDLFTPLLVLTLCLLIIVPDRLSRTERITLVGLTAFMIAAQQSSLLLTLVLLAVLVPLRHALGATSAMPRKLVAAPPLLAVAALLAVNLIGHGRFSVAPFGNVFILARVIYDGPGMKVLRRDCPAARWLLCAYVDRMPPQSDDFLWEPDSPVMLAGGHKAVSREADAIIAVSLWDEPVTELRAFLANGWEQLQRFGSGDGLEPWPTEVSPWIEQDFPAHEQDAYHNARQQQGTLAVPAWLGATHRVVALGGLAACILLLPLALHRGHVAAGFLVAVLVGLPASALITGGLSAPHDRYQSRMMWLTPCVASFAAFALLRRPG